MKFSTHWWGVEFLAETQEETVCLERLALSTLSDYGKYDEAAISVLQPSEYLVDDDTINGFMPEELSKAKLVLRIER